MNDLKLYQVIEGAHISEKGTIVADRSNEFVFRVAKEATKQEIKAAVEKIYSVAVKKVTVLNVKGKVKRTWRGRSRKPNWKKAYVCLKEGHDIDFATTSD